MAELELQTPCKVCKNFLPVTEVIPLIKDLIPDVTGHICSQGPYNGDFCCRSITTRFEPKDGVPEDDLKKYLNEDALKGVTSGMSTKRHTDHIYQMRFDRY